MEIASAPSSATATPVSEWSRDAEKPMWRFVRRRAGWIVFAFPAIMALSLIANGARQASVRGDATQKAERDLKAAFADIPFKIRLPTVLPENAPIVRVVFDKPDSKQGFQAYQLNVWYTVRGSSPDSGQSIHVWQTNDKFLARRLRDPLQLVGPQESINGDAWHRVVDNRVPGRMVTTFSRRFDDGITMTVDSPTPALARAAIAKLGTANG